MDPHYTDKFLEAARPPDPAGATDPQAVLHAVYAAVISGDFDALNGSVTDDVALNICGFPPINGTWKGRGEVVAAVRKNYGQLESQQPTIESMISQGDSIAVLMRETGVLRSTGQAYSVRGVQWFTFAGGRISKIDQVVASIWKAEP
jgi:ketosteroid isomerase-like protein